MLIWTILKGSVILWIFSEIFLLFLIDTIFFSLTFMWNCIRSLNGLKDSNFFLNLLNIYYLNSSLFSGTLKFLISLFISPFESPWTKAIEIPKYKNVAILKLESSQFRREPLKYLVTHLLSFLNNEIKILSGNEIILVYFKRS